MFYNRILRLTLGFFILSVSLFAQVSQEWAAHYNGGIWAMTVDDLGNVYVAGSTYEGAPYYSELLVVKYNQGGVQQWVNKFNGTGNFTEDLRSIAVDNKGYIYAAGSLYNTGSGPDYFTVKMNSAGDTMWTRSYNGTGNQEDYARKVAVDINGNVLVTGYSNASVDNVDYVTIKYDSLGNELWVKRYNGSADDNDFTWDLMLDIAGNVYITGYSVNIGSSYDFVTIKYDPAGNEIWRRSYNHTAFSTDNAYKLAIDDSSNVYVSGATYEDVSGMGDILTVKYNRNGALQWARSYNGPANDMDEGVDMVLDNTGNIYVTGRSTGANSGFDYVVLKYTGSGNTIWTKRYASIGNYFNEPRAIAVDKYNNVYVTGSNQGDYATIKYDTAGNQSWIKFYNGTGNGEDWARSIYVDSSLNVYVSGNSVETIGVGGLTTVKYSQLIGIININNGVPNDYNLSQNYPNPFNPVTKISFSVPKTANAKIIIYDAIGNEIGVILDQRVSAGTFEVEWDGSKFASGIYFYKLEVEGYSETRKMVMIK